MGKLHIVTNIKPNARKFIDVTMQNPAEPPQNPEKRRTCTHSDEKQAAPLSIKAFFSTKWCAIFYLLPPGDTSATPGPE